LPDSYAKKKKMLLHFESAHSAQLYCWNIFVECLHLYFSMLDNIY